MRKVIESYNEMTSGNGREVCLKGWKVSAIKRAVKMGAIKFTST